MYQPNAMRILRGEYELLSLKSKCNGGTMNGFAQAARPAKFEPVVAFFFSENCLRKSTSAYLLQCFSGEKRGNSRSSVVLGSNLFEHLFFAVRIPLSHRTPRHEADSYSPQVFSTPFCSTSLFMISIPSETALTG